MATAELPKDADPSFHVLKAAIEEVSADSRAAREAVDRLTSKDGALKQLSNHVLKLHQSISPIGKLQQLGFIAIVSIIVTMTTLAIAAGLAPH
jgi:ABC-type uncharacterized transport system permease subunit